MNKKEITKSILVILGLAIVIGGLIVYKKDIDKDIENIDLENTEKVENTDTVDEDKEVIKEENKNSETNSNSLVKYQELITLGHQYYLKNDYKTALNYFNQAVALQKNDRIYRSLYSTYLALGDYENARKSIKNSVSFNSGIPNNWVEYASFENNYMKSSFDVVSKIYQDALKATKENIDVLTSYSAYLTENKKYAEAITYLEKAKLAKPANASIYQSEIDRLNTLK